MVDVSVARCLGEAQVWQPFEQNWKGSAQFQSGQGGADTEVNPAAKGKMWAEWAGRLEPVGLVPERWIAPGGA